MEEGDPLFTPMIVPAAPTASELGRYGQVPLNLSTGMINFNIPLHDFKTKNITLPISITYLSNGIKVDQIASWVGMGWSLNAGGVITRMIRDRADDTYDRISAPEGLLTPSPIVEDYLNMVSETYYDTEPDLFSFNFNGISGQFVFQDSLKAALIPYKNIEIETDYFDHPNEGIREFRITTSDGMKYFFGGDSCIEKNKVIQSAPCGNSLSTFDITSWYLRKIVHPLGDSVCLSYSTNQYDYISGKVQTLQKKITMIVEGEPCQDASCQESELRTCNQITTAITPHLTRITSPGLGYVEFINDANRPDNPGEVRLSQIKFFNQDDSLVRIYFFNHIFSDNASGNRMFLDTLKIQDHTGLTIQTYRFEYNKDIDHLPPRLSYAQDHWGYYNGKDNNNYLVPRLRQYEYIFGSIGGDREVDHQYSDIGLLKKIVYPTGGYDIIGYEPNTINDNVLVYPQISNSLLYQSYPDSIGEPITVFSDTIEISFDQSCSITGLFTCDTNKFYCYFEQCRGFLRIYDCTDDALLVEEKLDDDQPNYSDNIILKKDHQYLHSIQVDWAGATIGSVLQYMNGLPYLDNQNVNVGGSRVAQVLTFDNSDTLLLKKEYYYFQASDTCKSSGHAVRNPNYYSEQTINHECSPYPWMYSCVFGMLHSSSVNTLYEYGSGLITYGNIHVSYGENFKGGGEEYKFKVSGDCQGNLLYGGNFPGANYNNTSWDNGTEIFHRIFRNDGSENFPTVSEKTSFYYTDERKDDEILGTIVRKNWTPLISWSDNIICNEENCHDYTLLPLLGGGYDTLWGYCNNICWDDTIVWNPALDNFDVIQYSTYSKWNYINKDSLVQYDENGSNPIIKVTNYYYDNPDHANLSRSNSITSQGDTIKSFYYYPQDYIDDSSFSSLISKSMTALPVDSREYLNDRLIKGEIIRYNDYGQAVEAYLAEDELGTDLPFYNNNPYSYGASRIKNIYDSVNHNLITFIKDEKILTCYEWGYESQFPISDTRNANYDEVSSTSFEDLNISGWQHQEQVINCLYAHSGKKVACVHTGNGSQYGPTRDIDLSGISEPVSGFKASVWVKSTSTDPYLNLEIRNHWSTITTKHCAGTGEWELLEAELPADTIQHYINGNNSIRVYVGNASSVLAYFDDIRIHPSDALMITYTYLPMVGLTSISNPGNIVTKFEYDDFGRLVLVRDNDGNILQSYEYHYAE